MAKGLYKMRARHFLVTHNGPEEEVRTAFKNFKANVKSDKVRNFSGQLEIGGNSTRLHGQYYVGFFKTTRQSALYNILGTRAIHVECAENPKGAWNYCKKDETREGNAFYAEFSDCNPGKRTDISETLDEIHRLDGNIRKLGMDNAKTYVKYHAGIDKLAKIWADQALQTPVRRRVLVFWGESGAGKTYRAIHKHKGTLVEYANGFFNFDPFSECLIMDEGDLMDISTGMWLRLLDSYPMQVNIKGGWATWNPKKIIITCNKDPADWLFTNPAMVRRVKLVKHFIVADVAEDTL